MNNLLVKELIHVREQVDFSIICMTHEEFKFGKVIILPSEGNIDKERNIDKLREKTSN